jgi:hypothetical protein
MRAKTVVSAATSKALFKELFTWYFIYSLLRQCGLRRRCPPYVTHVELIQSCSSIQSPTLAHWLNM